MRGIKGFLIVAAVAMLVGSPALVQAKLAVSPADIGVGARPLSMGRAYVAVADGPSTVFLNPAGLSSIKSWGLTSMYCNLLGEINYTVLGGVYPTDFGTFGIGYSGASISGCLIGTETTPPGAPPGETRITYEAGTLDYNNNIIFLSYGVKLKKLLPGGIFENVDAGANLKLFNQSLTTAEGSGSGYDLDIGILYRPISWLTLGVNQMNTLPMSMGAKFTWGTGVEESIPSLTKIGVAVRVLGVDAPFELGDQEVVIAVDTDISFMRPRPAVNHYGLEWWPVDYLGLRIGYDQEYISIGGAAGVEGNLTGGVGLWYDGFQFDYAYHQYGDLTENVTHSISISYGIWKPERKPKAPPKIAYITVREPRDKSIVYDDSLWIKGRVRKEVKTLRINGKPVPLTKGTFNVAIPLNIGKNSINLEALDAQNIILDRDKIRILRLMTFKDVAKDYWAKETIDYIATVGIVGGFPDGTFRPEGLITRAEMATLLVRAKGVELSKVTKDVFKDMPKTHWAARYIKAAMLTGLVKGYPDGTYRPKNNITRAEGITVLARFAGLPEPKTIEKTPFPGVPIKHWAAGYITAAKQAGILIYFGEKPLKPDKKLTRAESVEVLSRTRFAGDKIKNLLDFEKGY